MKLRKGTSLFILFLTLLFLIIILAQLDFTLFLTFFHKAHLLWIALSLFIYLLTYLLRGLRWRMLTGFSMSLPSIFHIVCLHTLANNLFPFRSGELTLPYFLKRFHRIETTNSLSSLFSARISDMLALGTILLLALVKIGLSNRGKALYFILFVLLALSFIPYFTPKLLDLIANVPLFRRYSGELKETKDRVQEQWRGLQALRLHLISLSIWAFKFLSFYLIIQEITCLVHFPLNYWKVVLGTSASELTTVLPIHSLGGVGTYEAGWVGAFILMGMERKVAVTTAFLFHLVLLSYSIAVGLPAYLLLPLRKS